jgi:hypothetical protein
MDALAQFDFRSPVANGDRDLLAEPLAALAAILQMEFGSFFAADRCVADR